MRDIPTSPRIIEIKRKRRILKIQLGFLFAVLFILIVWGLSFLSGVKNITISKIAITGTHIVDQTDIEAKIREDISGKYFYLFPKANSLIYPRNKIHDNLISTFPRIESLSVYIDSLNLLRIDIVERKGSYLYCGSSIPENKNDVGENCYFINNDGFIFDKSPYFSGNVYFKFYTTLKDGAGNPIGKQMVEVNEFHKIARFIDFITSLGFKPVYLSIGQDDTNYLYLEKHNTNGTIPKIIFKNSDDWEVLKDNLSISMKKKEFADEINSKYNTLLYLDLRFKNKVLYKFQ